MKAQRNKRWRARSEITTLKEELGTVPKMKEVRSAMVRGFCISMGRKMAHAPFSRMEHELIEGILKKRPRWPWPHWNDSRSRNATLRPSMKKPIFLCNITEAAKVRA